MVEFFYFYVKATLFIYVLLLLFGNVRGRLNWVMFGIIFPTFPLSIWLLIDHIRIKNIEDKKLEQERMAYAKMIADRLSGKNTNEK